MAGVPGTTGLREVVDVKESQVYSNFSEFPYRFGQKTRTGLPVLVFLSGVSARMFASMD